MSVLERVKEHEEAKGASVEPLARMSDAALRERLKHELVERLGLANVSRIVSSGDIENARRELGDACWAIVHATDMMGMAEEDAVVLVAQVLDEVCGLGPIQSLLEDETVTEIMINGCTSLLFERAGVIHRAEAVFDTPEQILMVMDRILAPLGRRLDKASPIVNARLENGDRVNAVAPPVAIDGPAVTIRKFSSRITSLEGLVALGALPEWYAMLLSWAVRLRKDIAVAGGTGSGKTTLLNALSTEIDHAERIVTIEDSAELRFDAHPNVVRLEAREASIEGTGEITIRDLVKNALRMRPDRIVVGECRGAEAIDMLQAMNTGHDGSLTTLHAGTADEAIMRLVLMARFGMDLPADIIKEQIATALDLIVMSARLEDGTRRITSLSTVRRHPEGGVLLEEVVSFDLATRTWELLREPRLVEEGLSLGVLDRKEVQRWRRLVS
ncbi:MAG: CpaF family protein [Atopobiaceae bacterium]|nr:CpaF family protein [Atopobiaceae bacterium]